MTCWIADCSWIEAAKIAGVGGIQVKLVCEKSSDALKGAWTGDLQHMARDRPDTCGSPGIGDVDRR